MSYQFCYHIAIEHANGHRVSFIKKAATVPDLYEDREVSDRENRITRIEIRECTTRRQSMNCQEGEI